MSPLSRSVTILCGSTVAILFLAWIGTAWYFSNRIIEPDHQPGVLAETVEGITTSAQGISIVSLLRSPATAKPGRWGLVWKGGSAMLGNIVTETPTRVDRVLLSGNLPHEGTRAGISGTYGPDPMSALGLTFSEITVPTELGPAPAWFIPADPKTTIESAAGDWPITVHGSSADRKQSLKFAPVLHRDGLSILDITDRNDIGAPSSSDRLMHLGGTEWRDLEGAVRIALSNRANRIVLYGGSMGGAIVLQFLTHSPLADRISAVCWKLQC